VPHKPALPRYIAGLLATFIGAWLTGVTQSMLPLAMGASVALMCTVPLVRQIWTRKRRRSTDPRP
jgi:hypothetical protein